MTEENVKGAFAGESQAHMKYMAFAEAAEKEKLANVARLFRANSFAEQIHATNHLRTLSGIKKTVENLQAAIEGETFEGSGVCGFTAEGEAPDKCPVCGAPKEKFVKF